MTTTPSEIPGTMRAARFDAASRRLTVEDVAVPVPGPGEVLVKVEACGICLSDVHLIELGIGVFFGIQSQSLLGHLGYKRKHLDDLVGLVTTGRLDISGSVSGLLPLEDVANGVEQLTTKRGDPIRLVVQPWT